MKDIFKQYHKHKVLTNFGILSLSAILAISINSFVLTGNTANNLKANVLESNVHSEVSIDFEAKYNENGNITFHNTQDMQEVTEFAFSLAYDADIAEVSGITSTLPGVNISEISNKEGFSSYIMTFSEAVDIKADSEIAQVETVKKQESTSHLNIIQVNFTDGNGEQFLLSSEGIMF